MAMLTYLMRMSKSLIENKTIYLENVIDYIKMIDVSYGFFFGLFLILGNLQNEVLYCAPLRL